MEWESKLEPLKDQRTVLKDAENRLNQSGLSDLTSPALIVFFVFLYGIHTLAKLSDYPALEEFFTRFLGTEFGKSGIDLALLHIAEQKVDPSNVAGAASDSLARGERRLRPGIFANQLAGKTMLTLWKSSLIVVCQFQVNGIF